MLSYFVSVLGCSATYFSVGNCVYFYCKLPPTKAGLAGICKGGSLSDSVCDKSCSALDFLEIFVLLPPVDKCYAFSPPPYIFYCVASTGFIGALLLSFYCYPPSGPGLLLCCGLFGVSVESGTFSLLIFLSSYGGEVGKFFVLVSFSTGGY